MEKGMKIEKKLFEGIVKELDSHQCAEDFIKYVDTIKGNPQLTSAVILMLNRGLSSITDAVVTADMVGLKNVPMNVATDLIASMAQVMIVVTSRIEAQVEDGTISDIELVIRESEEDEEEEVEVTHEAPVGLRVVH